LLIVSETDTCDGALCSVAEAEADPAEECGSSLHRAEAVATVLVSRPRTTGPEAFRKEGSSSCSNYSTVHGMESIMDFMHSKSLNR
uniref:Interleukin 12B n=1 Tax=Haemonchus placei TaxID=6290 RepID=A0A0N4W3W1_HAEPC